MASTSNVEQVGIAEIVEGITAVILAPVVLPLAVAVNQPLAQEVIKGGIALSEKVKEAVSQIQEVVEDLEAEVKANLAQKPQLELRFISPKSNVKQENSAVAEGLINVVSSLNEQVKEATQGVVDLRLLLPFGLSTLALRQLLIKGLQIEEIPWYVLAWYAFDSFTKLHETDKLQLPIHSQPTDSSHEASLSSKNPSL
jgi:Protein of unknown function (DUF5132)